MMGGRGENGPVTNWSEHRLLVDNFPDRDVTPALACEQPPAPLAQRGVAARAQHRAGALDERPAHVAASAFALAGVESDLGDPFPGMLEAPQ